MQIFHYHPETGISLGQGTADESPLEPGVWLIPAHATDKQPPKGGDGEQIVWVEGRWQVLPIPEPEPEPEPEPVADPVPLTPEQKLAAAGLTVEDLRQLLGLEVTP